VITAKPDHDGLYHRFFSDPAIVARLLREFVAGPWLDGLDLDNAANREANNAARQRFCCVSWSGGSASCLPRRGIAC
jgi:hypothetical protein